MTEPLSDLKARLSEALIINRSDSKCGACGQGADPHAETHAETRGYGPQGDGCGVRWRYVTSEYVGPGVEEVTREMRPDLEWFERWPGLGEKAA